MGTRIITGIVGMLITVYVVLQGGNVFGYTVLALSLVAWRELSQAFRHKGMALWQSYGFITVFFTIGSIWGGHANQTLGLLTISMLWILGKAVTDYKRFTIEAACFTFCGIVYIALPFSHMLLLRFWNATVEVPTGFGGLSLGCAFLWVAFIGTWASDTFAYFAGSAFGKHKLCPAISPGKTKEGLAGGVAGTIVSSVALGMVFGFSVVHMAILGVLIAIAATIGDLVESSFKRFTGIKDSGNLIPGHGGVLDRFDSLLFTVPLVYYYVQYFQLY